MVPDYDEAVTYEAVSFGHFHDYTKRGPNDLLVQLQFYEDQSNFWFPIGLSIIRVVSKYLDVLCSNVYVKTVFSKALLDEWGRPARISYSLPLILSTFC